MLVHQRVYIYIPSIEKCSQKEATSKKPKEPEARSQKPKASQKKTGKKTGAKKKHTAPMESDGQPGSRTARFLHRKITADANLESEPTTNSQTSPNHHHHQQQQHHHPETHSSLYDLAGGLQAPLGLSVVGPTLAADFSSAVAMAKLWGHWGHNHAALGWCTSAAGFLPPIHLAHSWPNCSHLSILHTYMYIVICIYVNMYIYICVYIYITYLCIYVNIYIYV